MKRFEGFVLSDKKDLGWALLNQGKIVQELTLPSGFVTPGFRLIILDKYLIPVE